MAKATVSGIWWQSANQNLHHGDDDDDDEEQSDQAELKMKVLPAPHLAETLVVKETQSLTKVRGVVPVMSSH